jgi:hypothetical protein
MSGRCIFAEAWLAYVETWNAANAFYLLNYPGKNGNFTEFEPGFDKYCSASFDAAEAALLTPALTAEDLARKQIIIDQHDVAGWSTGILGDVLLAVTADAARFAGGAA